MARDLDVESHEDGSAGPHIRTRFDAVVAWTSKPFAWLIFAAFAISVYEVFSRYALNKPTSWAHESTYFLIAVIFLIGGPVTLAQDKHIRVRIIYDAVSARTRRILDIVNSVVTLAFMVGLSYAAVIMTWKATHAPTGVFQLERTGTAWNAPIPAFIKVVMLICVVVMVIQTIGHIIEAIRRDPDTAPDGRER